MLLKDYELDIQRDEEEEENKKNILVGKLKQKLQKEIGQELEDYEFYGILQPPNSFTTDKTSISPKRLEDVKVEPPLEEDLDKFFDDEFFSSEVKVLNLCHSSGGQPDFEYIDDEDPDFGSF
eukprot:TRINITY_DN8673_c0_g1_i7.p1 TRINITY_DN8673_c0_g1~~TRINITY_DN8673_c0_g1_i7.p1  ORF type:complete len:122 (-),score=48.04 TRINITY_DN8673_c0_g1_i7:220-585(-)